MRGVCVCVKREQEMYGQYVWILIRFCFCTIPWKFIPKLPECVFVFSDYCSVPIFVNIKNGVLLLKSPL